MFETPIQRTKPISPQFSPIISPTFAKTGIQNYLFEPEMIESRFLTKGNENHHVRFYKSSVPTFDDLLGKLRKTEPDLTITPPSQVHAYQSKIFQDMNKPHTTRAYKEATFQEHKPLQCLRSLSPDPEILYNYQNSKISSPRNNNLYRSRNEENRQFSPLKSSIRPLSPYRSNIRQSSPPRLPIRQQSPLRQDLRQLSPRRLDIRQLSPSRLDIRQLSPSKLGIRQLSPRRTARQLSPRNTVPTKLDIRKVSPLRQPLRTQGFYQSPAKKLLDKIVQNPSKIGNQNVDYILSPTVKKNTIIQKRSPSPEYNIFNSKLGITGPPTFSNLSEYALSPTIKKSAVLRSRSQSPEYRLLNLFKENSKLHKERRISPLAITSRVANKHLRIQSMVLSTDYQEPVMSPKNLGMNQYLNSEVGHLLKIRQAGRQERKQLSSRIFQKEWVQVDPREKFQVVRSAEDLEQAMDGEKNLLKSTDFGFRKKLYIENQTIKRSLSRSQSPFDRNIQIGSNLVPKIKSSVNVANYFSNEYSKPTEVWNENKQLRYQLHELKNQIRHFGNNDYFSKQSVLTI